MAERGCSSHETELDGFGVIGVAWPLAFATPVADLHWGGTYWCTSSPIRLDDFALCKLRAVGDTTRHGDVVIDKGHIDPVRNGDAFETLGYHDHFDRREGHGKVLWHSQLGRWP